MAKVDWTMRLSRTASPMLMAALGPGGPFDWLTSYPKRDPGRFDVQLRNNPKTGWSWASLYLGLTSVLDVRESAGGLRLTAHPTHKTAGGFDPAWTIVRHPDDWFGAADAIRAYVDRASAAVDLKHFQTEGRVQALLSNAPHRDFHVANREVVISFCDDPYKTGVIAALREQFQAALGKSSIADAWWPGVANHGIFPSLGAELDAVGIDRNGRVLAIEVKPPSTVKGIGFGPAQVMFYAHLLGRLWQEDPASFSAIDTMLRQRVDLGLTNGTARVATPPAVVPVLAVGTGSMSPHALPRAWRVHDELTRWLPKPTLPMAPFEIWRLDEDGAVARRIRSDRRDS